MIRRMRKMSAWHDAAIRAAAKALERAIDVFDNRLSDGVKRLVKSVGINPCYHVGHVRGEIRDGVRFCDECREEIRKVILPSGYKWVSKGQVNAHTWEGR